MSNATLAVLGDPKLTRTYFLKLLKMHLDGFNKGIEDGSYSAVERHSDAISAMHNLSSVVMASGFVNEALSALNWLMMAAMKKALSERAFK